jgi:hypothetical protein
MDKIHKPSNTKSNIILLQFTFGFGMPISMQDKSLTMGIVLRIVYQLPTNATVFTDPYATIQKRSTENTRWDVYSRLEATIDRYTHVRLQVLMAAIMKIRAFSDVAPSSLVGEHRRFRGAYCLHQQGYGGSTHL